MALSALSGRFTAAPLFTPRSPSAFAPALAAPAISPLRRAWPLPPVLRLGRQRLGRSGIRPVLLVILLWLLAMLIAPEHPWDQEAICQRHNGVAACRVW